MRVHRGLNRAVYANAVKILAGGQYALRAQFLGDLSRPQAADRQLEYFPNHLCRRFVHDPPVLVIWGLFVAVGCAGGQRYLQRKASGAQKRYEDKIKAGKKAELDAKKNAIRAEDMAKGIYTPVGKLPRLEPQRAAQASAAV